jgi:hypothetical protein
LAYRLSTRPTADCHATQPAPGSKVDGVFAGDWALGVPFPCERAGAADAELAFR